jgi:hypothetical protein
MKRSISLSEPADGRLKSVVATHDSNPSVVLEAALLRFAELSAAEQAREIRHLERARRAATRDGWMHVFWEALAEEFGARDFDLTGEGNPMTLRQHLGFTVVFLLDMQKPTSGPIYVHAFRSPVVNGNGLVRDWTYTKDYPVFSAAREVATWIRENHAAQTAS